MIKNTPTQFMLWAGGLALSQSHHKKARLVCLLFCLLVSGASASAQTNPLLITIEALPLRCHGDTNGEIRFSASAGTPPYSYGWSTLTNAFIFANGTISSAGESVAVGNGELPANTYLLRIEDAAGIVQMDTVELNEPPLISVIDIVVENSSCATACDGLISMELDGGIGNLTTTWNDAPVLGPSRTELCAGFYLFVINDENGCTQKGGLDIEGPPELVLTESIQPPSCLGAENGSINIVPSGGVGEYELQWSDGSSDEILDNKPAGNYLLSLTDANDCSISTSYELPDGPVIAPNVQISYGCGDGAIVVSTQPIHGTAPYTYSWSTGSNNNVLYAVSAGSYSLQLEDSNGCEASSDFMVDFVAPLAVSTQVVPVSCHNAVDGQISLTINGGLPPFDILWNNGATGSELTNLPGGSYLFNLNASGCGLAQMIELPDPEPLSLETVFEWGDNNSLFGLAIANGGTPPYVLNWSTGNTGNTAANLLPETLYTVNVEDAHGCSASFEFIARLTDLENLLVDQQLSAYPNPSSDWVQLNWPGNWGPILDFQLYNSNGELLRVGELATSNQAQLDLSVLPAGIYYLRATTENHKETLRLVKR